MSLYRALPSRPARPRSCASSLAIFASLALVGPLLWSHILGRTQALLLPASLPAYELYYGSDDPRQQRRADLAPIELTATSTLELALRPAQRVSGRVHLRAYLLRDGQLTPWPQPLQAAPSGTFILRGEVGSLPGLSVGTGSLLFFLGRSPLPAALDSLWHTLSTLGLAPSDQVLACQFRISQPPQPGT